MLDKNDLQQIKGVVKETVDGSLDDFAAKHVKPSFDETFSRLDKVENRLDKVETDVSTLKDDVSIIKDDVKRLPDKDYLDKKLFELKGDIMVNIRKQEQKMNFLIKILRRNNLLNQTELEKLKSFDVFPNYQELATVI